MEVAVLGTVEAIDEGQTVRLGGNRQRAVLAVLVAHGPTVVTRETLVDNVWGDGAPATAGNVIQVYISQLRGALGRDRIRTEATGYRLAFETSAVDAWRFADLFERGSDELAAGDVAAAADTLRAGLALWRGAAFAGLDDVDLLRAEADRLGQLRLKALERRIEADLACGGHGRAVPELEALVVDYPLRERFWAQLMRALYADGRQAEALEAFQRARSLLADELGVDPGPELRDVEAAVLRHDARLGGGLDPTLPPLPASLTSPGPRFLGRDAEIAWLLGALERADGGDSAIAVVEGPPGSGKTRLVAEFARVARSRGVPVLYASGVDTLTSDGIDPALTGTRVRVLDDLEQLPAVTAGELTARVTLTPPGCLTVICYSEALATLPVRVALTGLVREGASMRVLGPLTGGDLARVARTYDPSATGPEVTAFVSDLGAAAPLDAHQAAATWATGRASQRVRAAAQALPASVGAANTAREALLSSLKDAQVTQETLLRNAAQRAVRRPYLGLLAYTTDDAAVYFGRENLVAELLSRLVSDRLLILAGASGSGKSSLVRAGLLPALAAGSLPGSDTWEQHLLTPGSRPDQTLKGLIEQLPGPGEGPVTLIVVDQLEEIFTTADDAARAKFGDLLTTLLDNDNVRVVATLRTDFFDQVTDWPPLATRIAPALLVVSPLGRAELRQVIEQPALVAGVRLEGGLAEKILDDAGEEPGVLPLLSTALAELWERREATKLTQAAYAASAGVQGAINRLAESTFTALTPAEQEAARRILMRLADTGPEQTLVRRRLPVDHVAGTDDTIGRGVLEALAAKRLLVVDRDSVEVAHEALLAEWDRLRTWLEEDAEGRRLRQQLTPAAHAWHEADRPTSDLYRGARLVSALEYAAAHPQDLTRVEREFIDVSQRHSEVEHARQRRSIHRLRVVAAALAVIVVVAGLATWVAADQRDRAQQQRAAAVTNARRADARSLAVQATQTVQPIRALLLSAAAVRLDDTPQTRAALLATLARTEPLSGALYSAADATAGIQEIEVSPDGSLVALREGVDYEVGMVRVLDASTGRELISFTDSLARDIEFSPDGRRMAVVADAGLYVFNATSPTTAPDFIPTPKPRAYVAFVGDGSRVAMSGGKRYANAGLGIWDLSTGKRLEIDREPCGEDCEFFGGYGGQLTRLSDGRVYAENGIVGGLINRRATRIRHLDPGWLPVGRGGMTMSYALSPDGTHYAVGTDAGELTLWELHGEQPIAVAHHKGPIERIAWSRDGQAIATASDDNTAAVWTVPELNRSHELRGHEGGVLDVAFSPDGQEVLTVGGDGFVYAWDLSGESALAPPVTVPDPDPRYYLSKVQFKAAVDGSAGGLVGAFQYESDHSSTVSWRIIVAECDLTALSCPEAGAFQIPGQQFHALSADTTAARLLLETGRSTLETGAHNRLTVLDAGTASATSKLKGSGGVLSPTASLVAAALGQEEFGDHFECTLKVGFLSAETLTPTGAEDIEHGTCTTPLTFSPDGSLIVVVGVEGPAVYDVNSGQLVKDLGEPPPGFPQAGPGFVDAAFSPDGEQLAIQSDQLQLWRTDTWTREDAPVPADRLASFSLQFSPSGDQLLVRGGAGFEVFDLTAETPSATVVPVDPGEDENAVFLANDRILIYKAQMSSASDRDEDVARVWPLDVDTWLEVACRRAGRELTTTEWEQATTSSSSRRPVCDV